MDAEWTTVKSVECLGEVDDYVYDLSIADADPFFFANDVLVHNTDSVYFSVFNELRKQIESGNIPWSKENVIELYDSISNDVNDSFVDFMMNSFHCPPERGTVIKAGREIVADSGIFITKKRYAVRYFDKDGKRQDINGKKGKIKAMGLDLKRSDTPKFMQDFLMHLLEITLDGTPENEVLDQIKEFRKSFNQKLPWEKGTPKRVNNMVKFTKIYEDRTKGVTIPGHVRAAINWNVLRKMNNDNYAQPIIDGAKTIVCKLKPNMMGITSVGYPIDELRLPEWFKELPFDNDEMEQTIIDAKIDNVIGVLGYDLKSTTTKADRFNDLFDFS